MFDPQMYATLRQDAERVAAARTETGLATGAQVCAVLRDVQKSLDVLDGVRADLLSRLETTAGHAEEGASTTSAWARRELRMGADEARKHTRAGQTLQLLPAVAQALADGRIRAGHVHEFTAGITKLGADVMADVEEILLPVAETSEPAELRAMITQLHEVLHPDELDDKYARGMERKDLKATKCGEGYHVSGFLDILSGAKFAAWLKDVSGPEYDGDDRTPAQRRVDAFCRLFDNAVADDQIAGDDTAPTASTGHAGQDASSEQNGTDPGAGSGSDGDAGDAGAASPQPRTRRRADTRLLVMADLETLLRMPGARAATLAGFGPIGQRLLGYLTCTADLAGILTHGVSGGSIPQADVLNVGRTHRLATRRQRDAVLARQDGECAAPGCRATYLEVHHVAWWDRDFGATNLDNLVGICNRCHHLVHQQKLTIRPDGQGGFTFHRSTGKVIDDHERDIRHRTRQIIADIARTAATGEAPRAPKRPAETPSAASETSRTRVARLDPQWLTRIDPDRLSSAEERLYDYIGHHQPRRT